MPEVDGAPPPEPHPGAEATATTAVSARAAPGSRPRPSRRTVAKTKSRLPFITMGKTSDASITNPSFGVLYETRRLFERNCWLAGCSDTSTTTPTQTQPFNQAAEEQFGLGDEAKVHAHIRHAGHEEVQHPRPRHAPLAAAPHAHQGHDRERDHAEVQDGEDLDPARAIPGSARLGGEVIDVQGRALIMSAAAFSGDSGGAVLNARGEIAGVPSSIVHDVREVGIVALPESLPDYYSISTMLDDPTRDVAGLALGTRAE